jgi:hypothetical protein
VIKGWKKLTKKELGHLKNEGLNNTFLFQQNVNRLEELRKEQRKRFGKVTCEPCWDCKFIARKLGVKAEDA